MSEIKGIKGIVKRAVTIQQAFARMVALPPWEILLKFSRKQQSVQFLINNQSGHQQKWSRLNSKLWLAKPTGFVQLNETLY